jgi:thiamine-monophosphate kinase
MGSIPDAKAVRRSGARPGDILFVTGSPGLAALGLAVLNGTILKSEEEQAQCIKKLNFPQPRLQEGKFLREFATSMIDISDGLAADLSHILQASRCSVVIDSERLTNRLPESSSISKQQFLEATLYGGDDYELLFTIPPEKIMMLEQTWLESFSPFTQIGEITSGEGIILKEKNGKQMKIADAGYNHFHD